MFRLQHYNKAETSFLCDENASADNAGVFKSAWNENSPYVFYKSKVIDLVI